jgi:hypothetical protein
MMHPFDYVHGEKLVENDCIVIKVNADFIYPYCCGYISFPAFTVPEPWWGKTYLGDEKPCHDIFNNIDAHGGITFAEKQGDIVVYGFDRAHFMDNDNPLSVDMKDTMRLTHEFHDSFLKAISDCKKTQNKKGDL